LNGDIGNACPHAVPIFLKQAISLAHDNGALFILDEMVTGFKTAFPGSIIKYDLSPDMATWGKGIANGFSFCALTGKKEVMQLGGIINQGQEKVFLISTTHGGETHSIAAGLETIKQFTTNPVLEHSHALGKYLIEESQKIIDAAGLGAFIEVIPSVWTPVFVFKNKTRAVCPGMRTLFMQEMIKRGILFQGLLMPSYSHQKKDMDYFLEAFQESTQVYQTALEQGYSQFLTGEPAKPVFRKHV